MLRDVRKNGMSVLVGEGRCGMGDTVVACGSLACIFH